MRALTWNLTAGTTGWAGALGDRVDLLRSLDEQHGAWEVFFAQEVPPDGFEDLCDGVAATGAGCAWHEQPGKDAATATGAALLVRDPWTLEDVAMLDGLPSPKRAIGGIALNQDSGQRVALFSGALPPGGTREGQRSKAGEDPWGERKAEQARAIADWIDTHRLAGLPVIVGIDANAPEQDTPRWEHSKYWWADEARLLGPDAPAKDALRRWMADNPDRAKRLTAEHPSGPLACTHLRGGTTPCRYDHILITDDVQVETIEHVVEPAFAAGSDHAVVHAALTL